MQKKGKQVRKYYSGNFTIKEQLFPATEVGALDKRAYWRLGIIFVESVYNYIF